MKGDVRLVKALPGYVEDLARLERAARYAFDRSWLKGGLDRAALFRYRREYLCHVEPEVRLAAHRS